MPVIVGGVADVPARRQSRCSTRGSSTSPGLGGGDRYTKRHPVPYGEYIPFRGSLIPSTYGKLTMVPRDMVRGTSLEPIRDRRRPGRGRDLLRRGLRRRDQRPGRPGRGAGHRADQQRDVQPDRPAGAAVRDQPAAGAGDRALGGRRGRSTASRGGTPRRDGRGSVGAREAGVLVETVGLSTTITPAVRLGVWPGRAGARIPGPAHGTRRDHLSSSPTEATAPSARSRSGVPRRERRRTRASRDGGPDLQRVGEPGVDRGPAPRGPAGRRRDGRRRQQS